MNVLPNEEDITAGAAGDDDLEVSITDDTPEEDRGRTPLSEEKRKAADPTDEELAKYSEDVKKRLLQLRHLAHDHRREAEAAARREAAALEFAKAQQAKAQQLEQRYMAGEKVFVGGMQEKAKVSIAAAEAKLKAATEAFDADKIVEATRDLNRAMLEEARFANWQPQQGASQADSAVVQREPTEPQRSSAVPKPDARATEWASKNLWFGENDEMTGFAYGIDASLAKQGITAKSDPDAYYGAIDRRMREKFPEKFGGKSNEEQDDTSGSNTRETTRTPVAPVRRSTAGKRVVTLTKSQAEMAKRLNLTVAQYAAELVALENRNG